MCLLFTGQVIEDAGPNQAVHIDFGESMKKPGLFKKPNLKDVQSVARNFILRTGLDVEPGTS